MPPAVTWIAVLVSRRQGSGLEFLLLFLVTFAFWFLRDAFGGRSVGKRLLGTVVLDLDTDQPCGFLQSVGRNVTLFIPLEWLLIFGRKHARLGDMLAHTIEIRTNSRTSIEETVFQEVADTYTPLFPQIMRLSDKDINAIKNILETSKKRGDFAMAASAAEKIKSHLKIDSAMSPFDFLEVLLMDYNFLSVK